MYIGFRLQGSGWRFKVLHGLTFMFCRRYFWPPLVLYMGSCPGFGLGFRGLGVRV